MGGRRSSVRAGGISTAVAVTAGAVALAFGTGYTASRAVLEEGGAWLSKGRTVTHVNAATGLADAVVDEDMVPSPGAQSVVQTAGTVAVVDSTTTTVTAVDTTTMTSGPSHQAAAGPVEYVVAGGRGYVVTGSGVQPVSTTTMQAEGPPIRVSEAAGAVATSSGVAVLDAGAGTVVEIEGTRAALPVRVAKPGGDVLLTAVGGRPVVVDLDAGTVRRVKAGGALEAPIPVPGLAGAARDDVAVNDKGADGATAWLVIRPPGSLVAVDLDRGTARTGALGERGPLLQSPVVLAGLVYVPSGASHTVAVIDAATLEVVATHEPEGTGGTLEVFAREGRVWVNDAGARHALVVEAGGRRARTVDKGTGHGVEEPAPEPAPDTSPAVAPVEAPGPATVAAPPAAAPGPPPTEAPSPTVPTTAVPPPPPQVTVPSVVGGLRAAACATVTSVALVCDDRPTKTAPAGTRRDEVLIQAPAPGAALVAGEAVTVNYYDPDPVAVPMVTGLRALGAGSGDPAKGPACTEVARAGLVCVATVGTPPAGTPAAAGSVFVQAPAAGQQLDPGATVTVTYAPTVPMPDLAGLAPDAACQRAVTLNLRCTKASLGIGSPAQAVVGQTVTAGTAAAADSAVQVSYYDRRPQVLNVVGRAQADACAVLAAEHLACNWATNPTNSINNPGLADAQSPAPGASLNPGDAVTVYHPAGPDTVLVRYRARKRDGTLLARWALAPYHPSGGALGSYVYNELESRQDAWPRDGGNAGLCYSTELPGTVALIDFMRDTPSDPDHQDHFYAAMGGANFARGAQYYPINRRLCFVLPEGYPARVVTEYASGIAHFYAVAPEQGPAGYTPIRQWSTW